MICLFFSFFLFILEIKGEKKNGKKKKVIMWKINIILIYMCIFHSYYKVLYCSKLKNIQFHIMCIQTGFRIPLVFWFCKRIPCASKQQMWNSIEIVDLAFHCQFNSKPNSMQPNRALGYSISGFVLHWVKSEIARTKHFREEIWHVNYFTAWSILDFVKYGLISRWIYMLVYGQVLCFLLKLVPLSTSSFSLFTN